MSPKTKTIPTQSKLKVLFLDDEPGFLHELRERYGRLPEVEGQYTVSPSEAMGWVMRNEFDVLVFDLNVDGEDQGVDFLIQARKFNQTAKLILYTGFTVVEENQRKSGTYNIDVIRKHDPNLLQEAILFIYRKKYDQPEEKEKIRGENTELRKTLLMIAAPLIKDLEALAAQSNDFKVSGSSDSQSAKEMLHEIQNLTPAGRKTIEDFVFGLNFLRDPDLEDTFNKT